MIPAPGVILIWKGRKFLLEHWRFSPPYATITKQLEGLLMDLSEMIDEIREIKIYETDPQDWMGVLEEDDYWDPVTELAY